MLYQLSYLGIADAGSFGGETGGRGDSVGSVWDQETRRRTAWHGASERQAPAWVPRAVTSYLIVVKS